MSQQGNTGGAGADELLRVERALAARWPESRIDPSLDRMRALMELLGDPQATAPVIQVTGTNGKTSTARMIESILRAFGVRTGLFTSPHLQSVTERIAFDGAPASSERFVAAYDEIQPYVELIDTQAHSDQPPMSFFEVITGMAYASFADAPVDVIIAEVGMGGRWDATSVADARVAVVTPVTLDHTAYLGSDPAAIAVEKAGIIKSGAVAVLAQQSAEVAEVLTRRSVEVSATVAWEGINFGVMAREPVVDGQLITLQGLAAEVTDVVLPLHGAHQAHNAACALAAVEAFLGGGLDRGLGHRVRDVPAGLSPDVVRQGLETVSSPGRLEVVRRSPTVLLDAAHNLAGAQALAATLDEAFSFTWLVGVIAVLVDKDAQEMLETLEPVCAEIVVTSNSSPRCLPAAELAELAEEVFGADRVSVRPRLDDALAHAMGLADADNALGGGGVVVTGSVITVGETRRLLGKR
jgi:dihydrofolate synthase / folylpolyglutamate synthase